MESIGEQTRCCGPGDIVTISGIFLSVRFAGYKGIVGGLQSNVYIESLLIEKQKLGYNDVGTGAAAEASVRYYHTNSISSDLTFTFCLVCLIILRFIMCVPMRVCAHFYHFTSLLTNHSH